MPATHPQPRLGRRFRSIVVPLDGSRLSEQAIPLAMAIAERARAALRLILVSIRRLPVSPIPPLSAELRRLYVSLDLEARTSEKAYLRAFAAQLKKRSGSVAVTSRILTGSVAATLLEYVHDTRSDLVVMTSRGQGGVRRLWLGSVADAMIRGSSVPVLLVRPEENPSPQPILENLRQILVPVDGSALSEAILEPAKELAFLAGAELMLVEVVQPLASPLESRSAAASRFDLELTDTRRRQAVDYLKAVAERCLQAGVKSTYSAPLGVNPADTILELAESSAIGLIAMATHGRGGIKRLALGSVADKLVRTAPRPMLVYRPPGRSKGRK